MFRSVQTWVDTRYVHNILYWFVYTKIVVTQSLKWAELKTISKGPGRVF